MDNANLLVMEATAQYIWESKLRDKALEQFSIHNPAQKKAMLGFFKNEEQHSLFFKFPPNTKVEIAKIIAVMNTEKEFVRSFLHDNVKNIDSPLQYFDLYESLENENDKNLVAIIYAAAMRSGEKAAEALFGMMQTVIISHGELPTLRQELENIPTQAFCWSETPNKQLATAVFYKQLSPEKMSVSEKNYITKILGYVFPKEKVFDKTTYQMFNDFLRHVNIDGKEYTVKDYTSTIKSGADLLDRIERYNADEGEQLMMYRIGATDIVKDLALLTPITGIAGMQLRISKEIITRRDRETALAFALEDIEESLVAFTQECAEPSDIFAQAPIDNLLDTQDVIEMVSSRLFFKIESAYIHLLYQLVITRCYFRDMAEMCLSVIYDKHETESEEEIGALVRQIEAEKKEKESLLAELQKARETCSQYQKQREKQCRDESKNDIIEMQRKKIKELTRQLDEQAHALENQIPNAKPDNLCAQVSDKLGELSSDEIHDRLTELLKEHKVVLVDGHDNYCRYMERAQPNLKTFPTNHGVAHFKRAVEQADFILCNSYAYGSHLVSQKAQNIAQAKKIPFAYLSGVTNVQKSEQEIYNLLSKYYSKEEKL